MNACNVDPDAWPPFKTFDTEAMTNPDPHKTQAPSSQNAEQSTHYTEETIVGMPENEFDTSAQTLIGSQQDLGQELPETSLRPKILQDGLQVDSSTVGQRRILPPEVSDPASGHVDYQTLELLGEGGMGQVHLARQIALGRNVAVKQIRPSLKGQADQQEFLTEAVVTGKLEHPNIVPIYEVGQTAGGGSVLFDEECAGATLVGIDGRDVPDGQSGHAVKYLRRHRLRTLTRRHSPRPETRQHHDRRVRRSPGDGLGIGDDSRRFLIGLHLDCRNTRLYVARDGQCSRNGRSKKRCLSAGRHAVSDAVGNPSAYREIGTRLTRCRFAE